MPKSEQLYALAKAGDVSMEWLLTGHEPTTEELILVGNSREAAGGSAGEHPSDSVFSGESEESLLKRIALVPSEEVQEQIAFVEGTIQSLRNEAEVFSEFATNLLLEAERLETMVQSMRTAYNAVARSNAEAVKEFERRTGKDDTQ